ncbi:MAG: hypothetical protein KDC43_10255 [Saprospiraceae bacterium]|nr:hypothetical protein [Saprospiraceae bacterium]
MKKGRQKVVRGNAERLTFCQILFHKLKKKAKFKQYALLFSVLTNGSSGRMDTAKDHRPDPLPKE